MDEWLSARLRCPEDGTELRREGDRLVSARGAVYPIVQGVPVLLREDHDPTLWVSRASRDAAFRAGERPADDRFLDTLGLSADEVATIRTLPDAPIDPVVSMIIPATSGLLYLHRKGRFTSYPIPELRLPEARGEAFLEVGCNWGRWCVAAARKGYRVIGIDPSLGALLAAKRVAAELGVDAQFVVADARWLPFAEGTFDVVFSYSVLQHLSRANVALAAAQIGRVLRAGGRSLIQMPNVFGVRCLYHQARRGFAEPEMFDVRHWRIPALERLFEAAIGRSTISVDGFFGLGIQSSDAEHLTPFGRAVCRSSDLLRRASQSLPALTQVADSVYVSSVAGEPSRA